MHICSCAYLTSLKHYAVDMNAYNAMNAPRYVGLTAIINNMGATNAQIVPFTSDSQQL